MRFFIQLDERQIDPLIRQIEEYLDNKSVVSLNPDEESIIESFLDTLVRIKKDMEDKLTEEEIELMKKRFNVGDHHDV